MFDEVLVWAACPVCDLTFSEELPELDSELRHEQLKDMIVDDLMRQVRLHKTKEHDELTVLVGVEV